MGSKLRARIVQLGGSRGIRIPDEWLKQWALKAEIEMNIQGDSLTIRRPRGPREGWAEAFQRMAANKRHELLSDPLPNKFDAEEWEW